MSNDRTDRDVLAESTRQSPIAVVFIAGKLVRRVGLINLGVAFAFALSGRLSVVVGAVAIAAAVVLAATTTLSWWRFTFCVVGDELLVTKGVLAVERLVIPLDRVQSVAIEQSLVHRVVGLVKASVDTAGTDDAEFTIDAVDRSHAEALQRLATGAEGTSAPVATADPNDAGTGRQVDLVEETLITRTPGELVRIGVTSVPWAGLVVLAPMFAFADELGGLFGVDLELGSTAADTIDDLTPVSAAIGAVVLVLLATAVGVLLQVVRTMLSDWGMTLVRTSGGLRRTSGLFSTRSTAATIRRVQSFDTQRSPIQRRVGIRRVTLETIGAGDLVVPGTTDDEVVLLHRIVFGPVQPVSLDRTVSRWLVFLRVRKAAAIVAAVTAVVAFRAGVWAAFVPLWLFVSWAIAERTWRLRRWGYDGERLAERHRLVSETTREIDVATAQAVTLRRSFFERRRGLASVTVDTASSSFTIPLIELDDAQTLRDELLVAVESSNRPGM